MQIASPTQVVLRNDTGAPVTVRKDMRLVLATSPPTLYRDPYGVEALGSFLTTDASGRILGYIDEDWFDYVHDALVTVDASMTHSVSGAVSSTTWNHTASGAGRVVFVAVAWQSEVSESISGVTYGGAAMTLVGSANYVSLYYLIDPATGTQPVVVTWDGNGSKSAFAGSVSLNQVDPLAPLGSPQTAQQTSASPSVAVPGTTAWGAVVDALGVAAGAAFTTITVGSGQSQLWSGNVGSGLTRTQGASSIEQGNLAAVTMSWTLAASKPWGLVAVEAKAAPYVAIDVPGSTPERSIFGVNALDFQTLQDAVNAVPEYGTLYLPALAYNKGSKPAFVPPLELPNRPIHILGAGVEGTWLQVEGLTNPATSVIRITHDHQTVEGLTVWGVGPVPSTLDGIVASRVVNPGTPLYRIAVKNCAIRRIAGLSLKIDDTGGRFAVLGAYEDLSIEPLNVNADGAVYIGGPATTTQYFSRCRIAYFNGYAIRVAGGGSHSFRDVICENPGAKDAPMVELIEAIQILFDHCYFEAGRFAISATGTNPYFGLTVHSCRFRAFNEAWCTAIKIAGPAKAATLIGTYVNLPGYAYTPGKESIIITDPAAEVMILGGLIETSAGAKPLDISDASANSVMMGAAQRALRLLKVTESDRANLRDLHVGDLIYNSTANKVQVVTSLGPTVWTDL